MTIFNKVKQTLVYLIVYKKKMILNKKKLFLGLQI